MIPSKVKQLLDNQAIAYNVTSVPRLVAGQGRCGASHVVVVMLEDEIGRLQVLFPADHLIDLGKLEKLLGRSLRATPCSELRSICQEHGLDALTGLPQLTGIPTIVDSALYEQAELMMESGAESNLLQLTQDEFRRILREATPLDATISVQPQEPVMSYLDQDVAEISAAVKNFTTLRIKQRLEETVEIPPLPRTAQRIIKLRVNPDAEIEDLTEVVEEDPSLAAQVVSWAASPYYAAPGKIKSIEDAIIRVLGFDLVVNLAIGLALGKSLALPKDMPEGHTPYWVQSAYCATAIDALSSLIPRASRPEKGLCYLSGLLHNFGYLVLSHVFPPHFSVICRHLEANPHASHVEVERHHLGICREQMAGWLMELWGMPEEVVVALRFQNEPRYSGKYANYARLLYVTLRLLREQELGDGPAEEVPAEMFEELNLDPEQARATVAELAQRRGEIEQMAHVFGH
ncbi:aminoacyl-tRNA deacylase and HDOD domain-containing protein [Aestuariirhabdus litorea]|uniref:HDOD domain-containing protein n=1 Tax=Aestuariirhabdus litorea TaxID=2528527 RepID=A0A3P3VIH2_9GAMM|nr:HDOD domain-containing protein [Aestuariirhabdus litorea]RRJ82520.1 HDOD domain-containing protein [Aestuariirhabdus litorea]RWW92681.1 HDOD domain-containing protein [Endozoicomonadaceae bacterium GTF-13]